MTVCIAASCTWVNTAPIIVGASDRMITVEDVEFEPPQTKVYQLTNSIAMLISGNTAIATEIANRAVQRVAAIVNANIGWVFVQVAADIVGASVAQHRREMTQRLYLAPFGLNHESFLDRQHHLNSDWVNNTSTRILSYVPGLSCIVTGLDTSGAHIYTVDGYGRVVNHDAAGFAAIGGGSRHAESIMMFSGHTSRNGFGDTLFLTYAAKKESEVSPGVGTATDMFMIPQLGGFVEMPNDAMQPLGRFYSQMKSSQVRARSRATAAMAAFLDAQVQRAAQDQETNAPPAPPEAAAAPPAGHPDGAPPALPPQPPPVADGGDNG
jgi:20S proteasome alpha/beta subunit